MLDEVINEPGPAFKASTRALSYYPLKGMSRRWRRVQRNPESWRHPGIPPWKIREVMRRA